MRIGILGSGSVGQTLGRGMIEHGHDVVLGTRDPGKLEEWLASVGGRARVASFAEAAAHGELVINATAGSGSLQALEAAGADVLNGKILIDVSNPLDFSQGMPPTLSVANTDSLAEQIQRAFPGARVVKTLNTVTAALMLNPGLVAGGDHCLFLSGNDAEAKQQVAALLQSFGWRQIIDLGDITSARGPEMVMPLWIRLWGTLGTPLFNYKIAQ